MVDWSRALCVGATDLFFSEVPANIKKAKEICEDCPIKRDCLIEALENKEAWGVWAGLEYDELRVVAVSLGYEPPSRKVVEHGTERGWAWHRRQKKKDATHEFCQPCIDAYNMNVKVRVAKYRKNKSNEQ
jgi:hypothetical protein